MKHFDILAIRRKKRDAREKKSEIDMDMNPMVDLAFLLLTFFMLTTTLTRPFAMELVMPAETDQQEQEALPVRESRVVTLVPEANGEIYYYRGITDAILTPFPKNASGQRKLLQQWQQTIVDPMVFVKPHPDSPFESTVELLDLLNQSQMRRYAFDTYGDHERTLFKIKQQSAGS
jgi:biopolymer transport protein ExbD